MSSRVKLVELRKGKELTPCKQTIAYSFGGQPNEYSH